MPVTPLKRGETVGTPLKSKQNPQQHPNAIDSPSSTLGTHNDDETERRKNRTDIVKRKLDEKSALKSPAPEASPKAEPPSSISGTPLRSRSTSALASSNEAMPHVQSPLAMAAAASRATRSFSSSKLNMVAPIGIEQMSKTFDEWMKMAADNKINSKNSWSFALIDYFSELTFLRDGDSINFQKASCTLDGCVKIYASRVDSVADETTKLLNGLSDKVHSASSETKDGDEEGDEGQAASGAASKLRRRAANRGVVETLEKNAEALNLKNFELEFSVDPLFKKTCAEFDETGGHGKLLHSLTLDPTKQLIVFDASDKTSIDFTSDGQLEEERDCALDISMLLDRFASVSMDLTAQSVCPAFHSYNFSNSSLNIRETLDKLAKLGESLKQSLPPGFSNDADEANPFAADSGLGGEDYFPVDDEYDVNYGEDEDAGADDGHFANDVFDDQENAPSGRRYSSLAADRHSESQFKWSRSSAVDETGLSYFDETLRRTWAGPEHWKIRRGPVQIGRAAADGTAVNRKSAKADKSGVDFSSVVIDYKQLFAKASSAAAITLTKAAIVERKQERHLLPDDVHFTSANLLKLFIKPGLRLAGRKAVHRPDVKASSMPGHVVDREFWAEQGDEHVTGGGMLERLRLEASKEGGVFAEQPAAGNMTVEDIYDDYYDDMVMPVPDELYPRTPGRIGLTPNREGILDFSQQLIAAPKLTYAPALSYARVAKRVDIAKLKSTLWKEFLESANGHAEASPVKAKAALSSAAANGSEPTSTFSSLINNLSKSYPTEALAEVSVPYCFICLLHLANENNLEIKPVESDLLILNQ
jgi:condensin complex subunit 2